MTGFRTAVDGYPAREAPSWTEEKLMILECYLEAFADACKRTPGWYSLDLFAGTGLNWSLMREAEIRGSPLIALEAQAPLAREVLLCELNGPARAALVHRREPYGERAVVFPRDANAVVGTMLERIPRRAPAFAFLDPEGSELAWPTVKAIADHKRGHHRFKVEQLILFPTDTGFIRAAGVAPDSVTRIFGHDGWQDIARARETGEIGAEEQRTEYVRLYAQGLRLLGYEWVLDRQITGLGGQPRYFLLFATDNEAGRRIMDWCFDQVRIRVEEELGQDTLFPTREQPRRRRL